MRCWMCGWPGSAPGGAVPFFASPKKGTKERRPCCQRPCASLRATCGARGRGAPRNSLRACGPPLKQPRRVRSRCGRVLRRTRSPRPLRASAQTEGCGERTGHCCARPWEKSGYRGRAQRWPEWVSHPLWPCREAQGLGRAWAAQHAQALWTDSLRLFERSAAGAQRVPQRRPRPEHRRLPRSAAQGTRPAGSPFFGSFLW